jgi:hypothetical protein
MRGRERRSISQASPEYFQGNAGRFNIGKGWCSGAIIIS